MMRLLLCTLLALVASSQAFVAPAVQSRAVTIARAHSTMTVLVVNGKKINAPAGSNLGKAVAKGGLKPNYSCKKGDCGSCTLSVGGTRIKACVGKVPPEPKLKSLQEKGLVVR